MHYRYALLNPDYIPVETFEPLLREWIDTWDTESGLNDPASRLSCSDDGWVSPVSARDYLAANAGVSLKVIWRILNHGNRVVEKGRERAACRWVTFWTIDRLLTAMGLTHLLYLSPEDGGFAYG